MKKNVRFERQQVVEALKRALADGSNVIMATSLIIKCEGAGIGTFRGEDILPYMNLLKYGDQKELISLSGEGEGECLFTVADYKDWMIHFDFFVASTLLCQVQFDPYYLSKPNTVITNH